MRLQILLAILPLALCAQNVTGIVSGYVFDTQSKVIRPVNGMPGAASLGDPLDFGLPVPFERVEFDASQSNVAYAKSGDRFYQLDLAASTGALIPGTSPAGHLAAPGLIWYPRNSQLQLVAAANQVFVASTGVLSASVLNPATGCATLAFTSGSIESLCGNNQTRLYDDPTAKIVALAFNGTSTFALDAANNQIIQLTPGFAPAILAANLTRPVGLATINDNLLAVADAGTQQLTFIALNGNAPPGPIALLFAPTELSNLTAGILRLGKAGSAPFEVIDLNQNNRNFFVPAIAPKTPTQTSSQVGRAPRPAAGPLAGPRTNVTTNN